MVETRAEEAFGGMEARGEVGDSFCKIMHVARPVIEVLANSATSAGSSGARGGGDVGSEGKVVGGPAVYCRTSEASVFIPLLKVLSVVILCGIGAYGLECEVALIPPEPCSSRYDMV